MSVLKDPFKTIILSALILLLAGIAYAWTEPSQSPPDPDPSVFEPITTSETNQYKEGGLVIDSLSIGNPASNALAVVGGISAGGQIKSSSGGFVFPDNTVQTSAVGGGIPTGAVMFFSLAYCPSGWSVATNATGRYLVGGSPGVAVGTALSNGEDRATGGHSHGVNDPGHTHTFQIDFDPGFDFDGGQHVWGNQYKSWATRPHPESTNGTGISIQSTGVGGTNAPYIQYLVCQKN